MVSVVRSGRKKFNKRRDWPCIGRDGRQMALVVAAALYAANVPRMASVLRQPTYCHVTAGPSASARLRLRSSDQSYTD